METRDKDCAESDLEKLKEELAEIEDRDLVEKELAETDDRDFAGKVCEQGESGEKLEEELVKTSDGDLAESDADPGAEKDYDKNLPSRLDIKLSKSSEKFVQSEIKNVKTIDATIPRLPSSTAINMVEELCESSVRIKKIDDDNCQLRDPMFGKKTLKSSREPRVKESITQKLI